MCTGVRLEEPLDITAQLRVRAASFLDHGRALFGRCLDGESEDLVNSLPSIAGFTHTLYDFWTDCSVAFPNSSNNHARVKRHCLLTVAVKYCGSARTDCPASSN
jgi:hypothetical protein